MLHINGSKCMDQKLISDSVFSFYGNLYKSEFNNPSCEMFIGKVKKHIVTIEDLEKTLGLWPDQRGNQECSLLDEGKSPGIDGVSVEFYIHVWDIIQEPLFCMYCECMSEGEMITTMKQGVISLILKPDKDNLLLENW